MKSGIKGGNTVALIARDNPASGLGRIGSMERSNRSYVPSNSNSKSTFRPISPFNDRHLSSHVASGSLEDLVRVPVIGCGNSVRVVMTSMEVGAVVRVQIRHGEQSGICKRSGASCKERIVFYV
jgi:hypothetical protein